MADENHPKNEQSSETVSSAPNQPIRENLVATAVHFLNNPRVNKSPLSLKTVFLQKKGLTEAEINVALARASIGTENLAEQTSLVPSYNLTSAPIPLRPHSVWYHIHRIGSSFIIIGIVVYGAHQLYKLYLEPWLFGKKSKNQLTLMEQQLIQMNTSLSQLKQTVSELQELVTSQKEQVNKIYQNEVHEYFPTPLVLNDLKAEVGSIKSLLLNRHQFPSTPKVGPSIPLWQMQSPVQENNSTENRSETHESAESSSDVAVNGDLSTQANRNDSEVSTSDLVVNGDLNTQVTTCDAAHFPSSIVANGDLNRPVEAIINDTDVSSSHCNGIDAAVNLGDSTSHLNGIDGSNEEASQVIQ